MSVLFCFMDVFNVLLFCLLVSNQYRLFINLNLLLALPLIIFLFLTPGISADQTFSTFAQSNGGQLSGMR
jgi:hypothetical protein